MIGLVKGKKFSIAFLLLFAIFQFSVKLDSFPFFTQIYSYIIPAVYLAFRYKWLKDKLLGFFNTIPVISLIIFSVLFGFSIVWPIFLKTYDFTYVTEYWSRFFIVLLKNVFLYCVYDCEVSKGKGTIEDYFTYFFGSIALYVSFTALTLIFPFFRNLVMSVVFRSEIDIENLSRPEYYTRFGWTGWSGYDESMRCTIGVMLSCILLLFTEKKSNRIKYLVLSGIMTVGTLFYGRTGMIVCILLYGITGLIAIFKKKWDLVIGLICLVVAIAAGIAILTLTVPAVRHWYNWVFSAFINYAEEGKFYDDMGSVENLTENMYWVPEEKGTLWIGDGRYIEPNGTYYMHTDAGYMRHMLFYGIVNYVFEIIACYILVHSFSAKLASKLNTKKYDKYLIILLIVVAIAMFEIKGEAFNKFICIIAPFLLISASKVPDNAFSRLFKKRARDEK